jgi:aspartyl-tRNA(Asn)/glutamyl-tRNA(Gln) amidotransferase subunit B
MEGVEVDSRHFIELLELLKKDKITPLKAKEIMRKFIPKSYSPVNEAEKGGKIDDENELKKIVGKVIKGNKKSVEDYKNGEINAINFLIGQVMKLTDKRADYQMARKLLEKELK